jgi:hypothetical protein
LGKKKILKKKAIFENFIFKETNFNSILNEFIDYFNWRYSNQFKNDTNLLYNANDDFLSFIYTLNTTLLSYFNLINISSENINLDSFFFSLKNYIMFKIFKSLFGQYKNNFFEQDNVFFFFFNLILKGIYFFLLKILLKKVNNLKKIKKKKKVLSFSNNIIK